MEISWERLVSLIGEFEQMVGEATNFLADRHQDWRPLFDKSKEIQAGFNSRPQFPTREEREQTWIRFNDLRSEMFERANKERARFREKSESIRNDILDIARPVMYDALADAMFVFDPTTVDEMKKMGAILNQAGRMLSDRKLEMLREHKDECFAYITEVRQSHDFFWCRYSEHREAKKREYEQKRDHFIDRARNNIRANEERLQKCVADYDRIERNIQTNLERLDSARGDDFASRVSGWIADDREKLRSVSGSIDEIRGWIGEDRRRLDDALSR